jgi:G3E family GTPase
VCLLCTAAAPAAVQQVAFADKILLNKTDLVSAADKTNVTKRIRVSEGPPYVGLLQANCIVPTTVYRGEEGRSLDSAGSILHPYHAYTQPARHQTSRQQPRPRSAASKQPTA